MRAMKPVTAMPMWMPTRARAPITSAHHPSSCVRGFKIIRGGFYAAACVILCACDSSNGSKAIAEAFCHRYFVEMNQEHALELAGGLAADKLRKEIELLKGAARAFEGGEREFHQLKPFTDYVLLNRSPETDGDADKVLYVYEIRIESRQDNSTMKRTLVLNTVKENGRWTVTNFDLEAQ